MHYLSGTNLGKLCLVLLVMSHSTSHIKTGTKGIIQYWPKGSQHLHARKMRAIWWIYAQNTRKKHASKILHELLHAPQLHVNCVYFGKG